MHEKILIAPLDWGLGHATRCVPIIRSFLEKGTEVEIASAKSQRSFFAQEFPDLLWHEAPSYNIKYPKHGWQMPFWIFKQMPRIKKIMKKENEWLSKLCEEQKYTQIISDNRFGFFNKKIKSIYITHQLRIAFPPPFTIFEKIGENWHKNIMKNFDEIWVPDVEEFPGLAGKLSHPSYSDKRIKYIGFLSRLGMENGEWRMENGELKSGKSLTPSEATGQPDFCFSAANRGSDSKHIDILAIISGPEPQRSMFERQIKKIFARKRGNNVIMRGIAGEHGSAAEMSMKILSAKTIVCRSGYSTLMDLKVLNPNAKIILVPTPGQTEQIYLAKIWNLSGNQ